MPAWPPPLTWPSTTAGPGSPGLGAPVNQPACIGWSTGGTCTVWSSLSPSSTSDDVASIFGMLTSTGAAVVVAEVAVVVPGAGRGSSLGADPQPATTTATSTATAPVRPLAKARRVVMWSDLLSLAVGQQAAGGEHGEAAERQHAGVRVLVGSRVERAGVGRALRRHGNLGRRRSRCVSLGRRSRCVTADHGEGGLHLRGAAHE